MERGDMRSVSALHSAPATKLRALGPLAKEDESSLTSLCHTVGAVSRRRDIISRSAGGDFVHILLSGWGARYSILADGSRRITAVLLPGDFLDLHGSRYAPATQNVTALTDCVVASVPATAFEKTVAASQSLAKALWRSSLTDENIARQWLASAGRADARTSVARLFCELHVRLCAIGLTEGSRLPLPITQEDIGDATGLTAVHVNRTIRGLREERLIEKTGAELDLRDIVRLRRLAAFSPDYLGMHEGPRQTGRDMKLQPGSRSPAFNKALTPAMS